MNTEQRGSLSAGRLVGYAAGVVAVAILVVLSLPLSSNLDGARHMQCRNNLKQIGLALHLYHEQWGSFPPAYVADTEGRPIHSWRTLILPYLFDSEDRLYNEVRFDEPWNSSHNAELSKRSVPVLECPAGDAHVKQRTSYLAVVGQP